MKYVMEDIINGILELKPETVEDYYQVMRQDFSTLKDLVDYITSIEDLDNKLLLIEAFAKCEASLAVTLPEDTTPTESMPVANSMNTTLCCNPLFPDYMAQLLNSILASSPSCNSNLREFFRRIGKYQIVKYYGYQDCETKAKPRFACYGYLDTLKDQAIDWQGIKSLIPNPNDKRLLDQMIIDYNLRSTTPEQLKLHN